MFARIPGNDDSATFAGSFSGTAEFAAVIHAVGALVGAFSGSASFSGQALTAGALVGSFNGSASVSGALSATALASANFTGSASFSGNAVSESSISGSFAGSAAFAGDVAAIGVLSGSFAGSADVVGVLTASASISGAFAGTGSLSGVAENGSEVTLPVTSGLVFHLDATKGVTGLAEVTLWEDQSASGFDLAPHASDDGPVRVKNGINGRSYIQFNGSNQSLVNDAISGLPRGASDRVIFVVARVHDNATSDTIFSYGVNTTNQGLILRMIQTGDDAQVSVVGTNYTATDGVWDAWEYWSLSVAASFTVISLFQAQTLTGQVAFTPVNTDPTGNTSLRLGRDIQDTFAELDVAEVLIYNVLTDETDTQDIWDYLVEKWGL